MDQAQPMPLDLLAGLDLDPRTMAILQFAIDRGKGADPAADAETLRERVARLERANRELLRMIDSLAGATGACRECWGADSGCASCGGSGHPGFFPPDRQAFEAFVLPVVRALAARTAFAQRRAPMPAGAPAQREPLVTSPGRCMDLGPWYYRIGQSQNTSISQASSTY